MFSYFCSSLKYENILGVVESTHLIFTSTNCLSNGRKVGFIKWDSCGIYHSAHQCKSTLGGLRMFAASRVDFAYFFSYRESKRKYKRHLRECCCMRPGESKVQDVNVTTRYKHILGKAFSVTPWGDRASVRPLFSLVMVAVFGRQIEDKWVINVNLNPLWPPGYLYEWS